MYQFFYLRKLKGKPKWATICRAVYDDRTPIVRESLKLKIPIKSWDNDQQRVRRSDEVDFERINYVINKYKSEFLEKNERAVKSNKECFLEFSINHLEQEYVNEETKTKYRTVFNSLREYCAAELGLQGLPIHLLSKVDFIVGYKKWAQNTQYKRQREGKTKRAKTLFNYVSVIQSFVHKYNALHPEKEEIKTVHYMLGIKDFDQVEPKLLQPKEIDNLINFNPINTSRKDKSLAAKYHFLFQFFTSGLRVSDILLLNFKHFRDGRIKVIMKKTGKLNSLPLTYKGCKALAYFYPEEYGQAVNNNLLGGIDLTQNELETLVMINSEKIPLELMDINDLHELLQFLVEDRRNDNQRRIVHLKSVIEKVENLIADSMCEIMGSKPAGLVFDYLDNGEFDNLNVREKYVLTKHQNYLLHKGRNAYNSRLKRIARDLGIDKITSHVSRHSFAYYMLYTGATVEEISHALGHARIDITQHYIRQFPSRYSDKAIRRFESHFDF
jgi:integrase